MKNMNCVNTMPEIMPEITDEAIIEALFAQRPYEEKVINSVFLEIPAEYQRKLNIPNVEKMSAEFTELIANPPKVSYRDGHYFVFDGQHACGQKPQPLTAAHRAASASAVPESRPASRSQSSRAVRTRKQRRKTAAANQRSRNAASKREMPPKLHARRSS